MKIGVRGQGTGARVNGSLLWLGGYCALPILLIVIALVSLTGCSNVQRDPPPEVWDDMKRQGKFLAQYENGVFPDHRDSRVPPAGTVARGHMTEDTPYFTGMVGDLYAGKNPLFEQQNVDLDAILTKGHARFNTYCSPCHDKQGSGMGIVAIHTPTWQPANLMEQRVVEFADGEIFNVVSNGRR